MTCTEEQAKNKWCPMVRFASGKDHEATSLTNCLAYGCMMWEYAKCPDCGGSREGCSACDKGLLDTGHCGLTREER